MRCHVHISAVPGPTLTRPLETLDFTIWASKAFVSFSVPLKLTFIWVKLEKKPLAHVAKILSNLKNQQPNRVASLFGFPCFVLPDESSLSVLIVPLSMKVRKSLLNSREADDVWQLRSWFCLRQPQTESNPVEVRALPLLIRVKPRGRVTLRRYSGQPLTPCTRAHLFSEAARPAIQPNWWSLELVLFPTAFAWSPNVITVSA